jgi:hypothetical protein
MNPEDKWKIKFGAFYKKYWNVGFGIIKFAVNI